MEEPLINRVEASGLLQLELKEWISSPHLIACDLAAHLVDGLVLKERSFRDDLKAWSKDQFSGKHVALHCSADAILPDWAWMLAASRITELGGNPAVGSPEEVHVRLLLQAVDQASVDAFAGQRVMVRGCASVGGPAVLAAVVRRLQPVVQSLMFGEACSSVPVYKKPRKTEH